MTIPRRHWAARGEDGHPSTAVPTALQGHRVPPGVTGAPSASPTPTPWRSARGRVLWGEGSVVVAPGAPTSGGPPGLATNSIFSVSFL